MTSKNNKKEKDVKTSATLIFNSLVSTKKDVDIIEFLKNSNEYIAEPKNSDGCIIAFRLAKCEISGIQKNIKEDKKENSDSLERYMHFDFRGIKFLVDIKEKIVQCNGVGLASEMISDRDEDGLYNLNVETSN